MLNLSIGFAVKISKGCWRRMKRQSSSHRGMLGTLLLFFSIVLGLWLDHRQFLQRAASLWVVDETVELSDAVAVFGGGIETRPAAAAEYLRLGLAHKILVSHVGFGIEKQSSRTHTELNIAELKKLGVAESDITIIGCDLSDTYQEVMALRRWSLSTGARSLIVPTEYFSARRVRWITQRAFQGTGAQVRVPVLSSLHYLQGEWWNHVDAPLAFGREVLKYVGYRLVYGLLAPVYEPGNVSRTCSN